jgi:hypothetical protein
VITFGTQIPLLGFVLDDWVFIDYYYSQGLRGLLAYSYVDNRPFEFWPVWLGFQVFGKNPVLWGIGILY